MRAAEKTWTDGLTEDEIYYELEIKQSAEPFNTLAEPVISSAAAFGLFADRLRRRADA